MMHEWDPHRFETLVICRHCKSLRIDSDRIDPYYKHHGAKYLYCNVGYYRIKSEKIEAEWITAHPMCTRFKETLRDTFAERLAGVQFRNDEEVPQAIPRFRINARDEVEQF